MPSLRYSSALPGLIFANGRIIVYDKKLKSPLMQHITAGSVLQLTPGSMAFAHQTGQSQPGNQILNVTTPAGTQVPFTVAAQTTTGVNWLNVTPTSASTPNASQ